MSGNRLSLNRLENEINRSSVKAFLSDVLAYEKCHCESDGVEYIESGLCTITLNDNDMIIECMTPIKSMMNNAVIIYYSALDSIRIEPVVRGGVKVPYLYLSCYIAGPEIALDDRSVKIKYDIYNLIRNVEQKNPGLSQVPLFLDNLIITENEREEALIDPRRLLFERVMDVRGLESSTSFEVWIVWSCKTLQNRKWIMATSLPDNSLYELTYNGETGQFYLDEYEKVSNTVINTMDRGSLT